MTFNFVTVLMLCNALFVNGKGLPQTEKDRIDTADLLKQLQEPEDDYFPGKSENRLPHEMFLEDSSNGKSTTKSHFLYLLGKLSGVSTTLSSIIS